MFPSVYELQTQTPHQLLTSLLTVRPPRLTQILPFLFLKPGHFRS